ncbi:hypothetical protein SSX86_013026 [Deinandra increscens subsp. villosa]|uniref:Uncharacterized protein n=1 Tax=Deinandra increscens subsp. villosa TaxID=3103831 RepID=A0AAP0H3U1_9ASTR
MLKLFQPHTLFDFIIGKLIRPESTGTTDQPQNGHHQIIITTGPVAAIGTTTKSTLVGKRSSSFKQTSIINPKRVLFFFATLSSMGSILLIFLTLCVAEDNNLII